MSHFIRTIYVSYSVPSTETRFFSGDWGEGGRLLQILSLRRAVYSKWGTYLKLGANSSIYGTCKTILLYLFYSCTQVNVLNMLAFPSPGNTNTKLWLFV